MFTHLFPDEVLFDCNFRIYRNKVVPLNIPLLKRSSIY